MKIKSINIWVLWLLLVGYAIYDNLVLTNTLTVSEALNVSSFTRLMFWDIGLLSTILAYWMVFHTNLKIRYVFAVMTLFAGSFAFLPYLAIYLKSKEVKD